MKILVTGGAGFIGSHIVDAYLKLGHKVVIIDDLSTGKKENLNKSAKFYLADLRAHQKIARIFAKEKPDIVNHHAAQMDVRRSTREPIFDAECNILGTINLLQLSVKHKVKKIIYANTGGALYGEIDPKDIPVDENYPIRPICEYGISKHTVEHYLYAYGQNYDLDYVALRYPNVYGPRQDPHGEAGVVAIFTGKMLKGEAPTIYGDGRQTRDYAYMADIVKGNILTLNKGHREAFNLGTGTETSVNQVFAALEKLLKTGLRAKKASARLGEVQRIALSNAKAKKILGWRPQHDFAAGIKKTILYYQSSSSHTDRLNETKKR